MSPSRRSGGQSRPEAPFRRINGFLLNAVGDTPDFRDYIYQPALVQLAASIAPPDGLPVMDQGRDGACTGCALAAVINLLLTRRGESRRVSARMLYEMAKKFDDWAGEDYQGSSCRGAVRGWHGMGVCSEALAPYRATEKGWQLNIEQARDARATTLGAYYRVRKRLSDFHAAINEAGVLLCSASVHSGWYRGQARDGRIPFRRDPLGGHAFAIVGYDEEGFRVQNSWGGDWGEDGLALWSYEDWLHHVRDAWVVRLAISTPQVWHLSPSVPAAPEQARGDGDRSPRRAEIVGHFAHIDDGRFDDRGRYWSDLATVEQTAGLVADSDWYEHLLFYAHGGLNTITDSARRIAAFKDVFMDNRIYPFHFMYDTGLLAELKDVVLGKRRETEQRAAGLSEVTDRLIERLTRVPGRALWREMKRGAQSPFEAGGAGQATLSAFIEALAQSPDRPRKIHVVGHSTGAILLAALLGYLAGRSDAPRIQTCLLLAPACSHDLFNRVYRPLLNRRGSDEFGLHRMAVYALNDHLERDDTVTPAYRKSLLYLVSNAFEERRGERLLGMQKFRKRLGRLPSRPVFRFHLSDGLAGPSTHTAARSHGGFDNDPLTMNHVLRTVLRRAPERPFTAQDLEY